MHGDGHIGFSDGELAELAQIVHDVEACQETIAAAEATQTRALARAFELAQKQAAGQSASTRARDMALRGISAEIAASLRTTDRSAQRQIGDAAELAEHYPATLDAWQAGEITRAHVRVIRELGLPLPADERRAFEDIALPVCQHETPGRARSHLTPIVERLHPRTLTERHQEAREGRAIRVTDIGDGMSELIATLPTLLAHAVYDRLTTQGRAVIDARAQARDDVRARAAGAGASGGEGGAGGDADSDGDAQGTYSRLIPSEVLATDTRSLDQIRADVFTDMLLTASPDADPTRTDDGPGTLGAIRARVQVVVPALTALGTDNGPADLTGHAPIDAETARVLLGTTTHPLERLITEPVTGSVIEVDTYHRPASLDRYLRGRDQRCRFPGCRMPAVRCEVDHTIDWALGGRTRRRNLCHLCQRHHSMKQFTAWKVRQLADGRIEWTSPLGRVYIDEPPSPVTFMPDDDPGGPDDDPDGPDDTYPPRPGAPWGGCDRDDAPF